MTNYEQIDRLKRIETKLVVFAEAMGISTDAFGDWLTVDSAKKVIHLSTIGRSLAVIAKEAAKRGGAVGNTYELVHNGKVLGTLNLA